MTIIYILVGIIAICGLIGTVVFVQSWFKHGLRIARHEIWLEEMSDKDIEFINNYEYCPKSDRRQAPRPYGNTFRKGE